MTDEDVFNGNETASDQLDYRFVVLHHTMPPESDRNDHFDLLFEWNQSLLSWAIEERQWQACYQSRTTQPKIIATALRLPNHRIAYLDYEGSVTGNRGHVTRVASGTCRYVQRLEDGSSLQAITIKLQFNEFIQSFLMNPIHELKLNRLDSIESTQPVASRSPDENREWWNVEFQMADEAHTNH